MTIYGQFVKGVIVLNGTVDLPEGALVKVEPVLPESVRRLESGKSLYSKTLNL